MTTERLLLHEVIKSIQDHTEDFKALYNILKDKRSYHFLEGLGDSRFTIVGNRAYSVKDLGSDFVFVFNTWLKLSSMQQVVFHPNKPINEIFTVTAKL